MGRFDDKVALITGASSGIGAALAREFASQGAAVALLGRRRERLEALAAEISATGRRAVVIACDVTVDGDIERAVAITIEELGRVDVAVANAGFGVAGRFEDLTIADYRRQFETNVFGVLRTAYAARRELEHTRGTLVLLGSVAGYLAAPGASAYAMSKFAVRALAAALRGELAPHGVAVVLISPGFVESEIRRVDNRGRLHADAPDPVPIWLRMPAERAARSIVSAAARRRTERILTGHGKLTVALARHFPRLTSFILQRSRTARPEPTTRRPR